MEQSRFGLSWQIVPHRFVEMMRSPDQSAVTRIMQAMFTMTKLDVAKLEAAFTDA